DFGAQPRAISSPKHSYHRAVPGRRNHRHAGAAVRPTHVGGLKPKRGRGERRRSRRIARRRPSREGRPRRLHASVPQHHLHDDHVVAAIRGRSPHDIEQDFVRISVGAYVPLLLLSHPSVPARDLKEFVGYARQTKEPLFYGSTGPGSVMNLMGEVLKRDAGIKMDHVPFRGAAPLVQEMLSGRIQFGGDQLSSSLQHVRAGALTALAVTSRSAAPEVASTRGAGFPNLDLRGWNGFFAPKGTPEPVIARLHQEIAAAAKHPDLQKRMTDVGAEPSGSSRDEMREMLREQIAKVRPMVEELK